MSKSADISVLTANRLGDGIVVFLDFEGAWSETLAEAVVARSPDEVRALQDRGTYDAEHNLVVEPYLVEVRETAGGLVPIRYRERVRAAGPSILEDVPGYVRVSLPSVCAWRGRGVDRLTTSWRSRSASAPRPELVEGRASRLFPGPGRLTMYRYDEFDAEFVRQRVAQFRDQVGRRLSGELTEDEFKPLRLMNGVYLQLHAYMLRIAIPYGTLSSRQMRKLAHIARTYDRGTGHFTTRQNLQFNWPKLVDIPDILDELASVEMHAIQTSGNCIRNVTADHFAGAAADEVADPRPYAEIIRQWSSLHPEFSFLPRKFKVAVTAAEHDRAAIQVHDIGLQLKRLAGGGLGFAVYVGGGQGRTPIIAKLIRDELPEADLLSYLEAVLRVYNLQGRRDNKYKARIKILVHEIGAAAFSREVEEEWQRIREGALKLPEAEIRRIEAYFAPPAFDRRPAKVSPAPGRPRLRALGDAQHAHPQAAGLRHRHHLAEARRRHPGRRQRRARWTPSPISPSAIPSTRCASRTSRTWCCRTCASRTCARSTPR